jgi:hypothetical protein
LGVACAVKGGGGVRSVRAYGRALGGCRAGGRASVWVDVLGVAFRQRSGNEQRSGNDEKVPETACKPEIFADARLEGRKG